MTVGVIIVSVGYVSVIRQEREFIISRTEKLMGIEMRLGPCAESQRSGTHHTPSFGYTFLWVGFTPRISCSFWKEYFLCPVIPKMSQMLVHVMSLKPEGEVS